MKRTRLLVVVGLFSLFVSEPDLVSIRLNRLNAAQRVSAKHPIEMTFVGDVMFGRYKDDGLDRNPEADVQPFERIKDQVKADVVVGNLETVLLRDPPTICPWPSNLRFAAGAWAADALTNAGFTVMTLANNHAYDMKGAGLKETRELLREKGILPVGVTGEDDDPIKVVSREVKGWRIGFIGFTSLRNSLELKGVPPMPYIPEYNKVPARLSSAITRAKAQHDIIVVLAHWGEAEQDHPTQGRVEASRRLIDMGAHLVIGHHPHVLQGIERYNGGLIAHSLGDFLFDKLRDPSRLSGVLRIRFEPDRSADPHVLFHPVVLAREKSSIRPEPALGKSALPVVERLSRLSRPFNISWTGIGDSYQMAVERPRSKALK